VAGSGGDRSPKVCREREIAGREAASLSVDIAVAVAGGRRRWWAESVVGFSVERERERERSRWMRGGVVAGAFNGGGGRWWPGSVERERV
jgi:hypothetical protein